MITTIFIIIGLLCIGKGFLGILKKDEKKTNNYAFGIAAISFLISIVFPAIKISPGNENNPPRPTAIITNDPKTDDTTSGNDNSTENPGTDKTEDNDVDSKGNQGNLVNLTGTEWIGELGESESKEVCYKPIQSGKYRFDFIIKDVNTRYRFSIKNSNNNEEITDAYSEDEGVTEELQAGQSYTLSVEQNEGDVQYHIKIGVPQATKSVEGTKIQGKLGYTNQVDEYIYTAKVTGDYRFDFITNNVEERYQVVIYESNKKEKLNTYSEEEGGTVRLEENEKYTIQVIQQEGTPTYSINIGVPNALTTIGKTTIAGNIKFVDQQDQYIYKPPRSGIYRFDFNINDVNNDYQVIITDKKNDVISENYCSNNGCTVELKGKNTYYIYVKQKTGTATYKIKIHPPKKITTTQNSNITGKISFIDQEDIIHYSVSKTGTYRFEFHTNNTDNDYRIILCKWNNENIFDTYYSYGYKEVKLEKGKKYKLYIQYISGFENYNVHIHLV